MTLSRADLARMVEWNADGSYTPRCEACGYEGKVQWTHHRALQAMRGHVSAQGHRRAVAGQRLAGRVRAADRRRARPHAGRDLLTIA